MHYGRCGSGEYVFKVIIQSVETAPLRYESLLTTSVRLATFCHVYMVLIRSCAVSGGTTLLLRASWTALSSATRRAEMLKAKYRCDETHQHIAHVHS